MNRPRLALAALLVALAGGGAARAFDALALANDRTHVARAASYETADHFPGAALFYAADEETRRLPAPAGETGTAPLPEIPAGADLAAIPDGTVIAVRPIAFRGRTPLDSARAQHCLATAIYYEAANEPDAGQRAVAQVILNRVRHPAFPGSVCGVVFQGSERRTGCQFSFTCDGAMARAPVRASFARAAAVAYRALAGEVYGPAGHATHYHTYAVTPSWNKSLVMTGVFGAHFFHRWKGYWGTPAAFRAGYAGIEPEPGSYRPRPPAIIPIAATTLAATPLALPVPATLPAMVQPPYARSGDTLPAYAETLPDSQILDKWKDSGTALR